MPDFMIIIFVLLALVAVGFAVWGIVRHRYVQSLRAKGWEFITSPALNIVLGLNVPPFGVGFNRRVDDQILGKAKDGTPFSAFKYFSSEWRTGDGYVVAMPLPSSLPPGVVTRRSEERIRDLGEVIADGNLQVSAPDPSYARLLLGAVGPHVGGPFRVSVDHDNLVLVGAPSDADGLEAAVEQLAGMRSALLSSPAAQLSWRPAPKNLSFYERPEWIYLPQADEYLRELNHTGGGFDHQAHDVILAENDGLPFIRLRHRWKTRHTTTDSEGRSHTETREHEEILCEFRTSFPFPDLSVNWGLFGRTQKFEWEDFNRRFTVRTDNPRFGSDVIHQRQMEYLMRANAPKFQIANRVIRVGDGGDWLPGDIAWASDFLHGFFGRVPNFVWQQLGAWPRPIAELESNS